jgi:hypothetical protein
MNQRKQIEEFSNEFIGAGGTTADILRRVVAEAIEKWEDHKATTATTPEREQRGR